MWDSDLLARHGMPPDFVAARAGTIKLKSKHAEPADDLAVGESRQASHQETGTGTRNSWVVRRFLANTAGRGSPCSRQDSTILRARPCAISTVSATLRPSATNPGTSGLVPR